MKPYAKYVYKKPRIYSLCSPKFVLVEHTGVNIPIFPFEWISLHRTHHSSSGALYPDFKGMQEAYQFPYALLLGGTGYIGLNHISELSGFHLGYFGEDAVLIMTEKNRGALGGIDRINIWFFEGMKQKLATIYYQCISCQLELD